METLGLGVVRAVDPASKMLYVLSQLPEQDLQRYVLFQKRFAIACTSFISPLRCERRRVIPCLNTYTTVSRRVDTLVRGKLELPLQALNYYPASGRAPYLVIESLGVSNTGSSSMRSRSNILRKGHSA
eukprot:2363704-Rhodomonas_salina.3